MGNILVAYFSATGRTAKVARKMAGELGADIYEIQPVVKYEKADLNWMDKKSRSTIEMNNKSFRPEIIVGDVDVSKYDTIYLGFPIWWYVAPTIINTFLESYDLTGKTIIPFATSGGSGIDNTVEELKPSAKGAVIKEGTVLNRVSSDKLAKWLDEVK